MLVGPLNEIFVKLTRFSSLGDIYSSMAQLKLVEFALHFSGCRRALHNGGRGRSSQR